MGVNEIADSTDPLVELSDIITTLHAEGPSDPVLLEKLSFYKIFHPDIFSLLEEEVISALGLFYKNKSPNNIYSFLMSAFGEKNKSDYGAYLTPVQASIRRAVENTQFVSISAPTSAGKSYSIRDFIADQEGDAVVVVPSRALIAEYVNALRRKFLGRKDVMISAFVDRVYTSRKLRRIFVITPERSRDLYSMIDLLNIQVFFFDEAQVSDEKERGIIFDVMVRRVRRNFPSARLIFAHPFVDNPGAQFSKHGIAEEGSYSKAYSQGAVGRVTVFTHTNGKDYFFSPYVEKGHRQKYCSVFKGSFKDFALDGEHTVLVYVSKQSIYRYDFVNGFEEYINKFDNVTSVEALNIIENIKELIGADEDVHVSDLISLMRKGVVIHHGSVPLDVRFLVEDFIRNGHARICFATSTLAQGINMPFDIVWLENSRIMGDSEAIRALAFKNLVGRSGRLSDDSIFDFGYVYTKNAVLFSRRINTPYKLNDVSVIDIKDESQGEDEVSSDTDELLSAIRNNTFDDEKNLPRSKVERLSSDEVLNASSDFLDIIFRNESIRESIGGDINRVRRKSAMDRLKIVFEASLGRELYDGESAVFENAISIFFLVVQGYSFREIAGLRYARISLRDEGGNGEAMFSQPASRLPDSSLYKTFSIYPKGTLGSDVRFDAIVYDTYDYVDQVISFSLSEVFSAAFKIHYDKKNDDRSLKMIELFKYGTNDSLTILLIRYGFPPEEVSSVLPYVQSISESTIEFNDQIANASDHVKSLTDWYLP